MYIYIQKNCMHGIIFVRIRRQRTPGTTWTGSSATSVRRHGGSNKAGPSCNTYIVYIRQLLNKKIFIN